jgi:hypothetical protein
VDSAVRFILSLGNVSYLSWGTKKLKVDGRIHVVPSILRKTPISVAYDQYCQQVSTQPKVSRATFYRMSTTLTDGEVCSRKAVDYVSGILVNDTFDVLKRVLSTVAQSQWKNIEPKLDIVRAWLKYGFPKRTSQIGTECDVHDTTIGLALPQRSQASTQVSVVYATCDGCKSFHTLFAYIRSIVEQSNVHVTTLGVVDDISHKLHLFMAHRIRVVNQQEAIEQAINKMNHSYQSVLKLEGGVFLRLTLR